MAIEWRCRGRKRTKGHGLESPLDVDLMQLGAAWGARPPRPRSRTRRRLTGLAAVAIAVTGTAFVVSSGWIARSEPPGIFIAPGFFLLCVSSVIGFGALSDASFERLGRHFDLVLATLWWATMSLWAASGAMLVAFGALTWWWPWSSLPSQLLTEGVLIPVMFSLVMVVMALLATTVSAPMLSASDHPRLFQGRWALTAWTGGIVALLASLIHLVLRLNSSDVAIEVGVAALVTLLVVVSGWHRGRLNSLNASRREVLGLLASILNVSSADDRDPRAVARCLRALEDGVTPGPFRSHSPVASPTADSTSLQIFTLVRATLEGVDEPAVSKFPTEIVSVVRTTAIDALMNGLAEYCRIQRRRILTGRN